MNKNVDIRKNAIILFVINLIVLMGSLFLNTIYTKQGYSKTLILINLIINILFLIIGVIFNVLFIYKSKQFDNKKCTIIILACFVFYILFNSLFMTVMNSKLNKEYEKINNTLLGYCVSYDCNKYDMIKSKAFREFVFEKTYFDYDNKENKINITVSYNTKKVLNVKAVIYSRNNMFSESIIKDELQDYFSYFNAEIDEAMIKKAFEKRFVGSVNDGNIKYRVEEVYKDNALNKIKTIINLNLN